MGQGNSIVLYLLTISLFSALILNGCGNTRAKEELSSTVSEMYYQEIADLHILPQTMQIKLDAFQNNDPSTHHYLDETIGAMELWAKTKPYVFYEIESLQPEAQAEIAKSRVNSRFLCIMREP